MTTTFWKFKVRGPGHLPLDMLRYDRAVPETQEDVQLIDANHVRTIGLLCFFSPPSAERWSSFGWQVLNVTKTKV